MSQTITWFICDSRPAYSQDQQCSRHLRVNKLTFNSQDLIINLLTVCHTILVMLVWRI